MSPFTAPDTLSGFSPDRRVSPLVPRGRDDKPATGLWRGAGLAGAFALMAGAGLCADLPDTPVPDAPLADAPVSDAVAADVPATSLPADGAADAPLAVQQVATSTYSGSMEPCLLSHGQRDLYRAGLLETGWVDISEAGRPVAIAMLADAFLPITGALDGAWEDHLAHRPASYAFWADMAQNRTLMEREGRILLLAGFLDPGGEMRVECWTAGPETGATDSFFVLAGQVWQSEGVTMTQLNIPANGTTAETDILVSRITPPGPMQPPLAASDGLRTTTIFPMTASQL